MPWENVTGWALVALLEGLLVTRRHGGRRGWGRGRVGWRCHVLVVLNSNRYGDGSLARVTSLGWTPGLADEKSSEQQGTRLAVVHFAIPSWEAEGLLPPHEHCGWFSCGDLAGRALSSSGKESRSELEADAMRTDPVRLDPVSAVSSPSFEDDLLGCLT